MLLVLWVVVFLVIIFVVQAIAFITLYERHLLGGSQQRIGPNKVSFRGLVQAIFDGVKLLKKEQGLPLSSSEVSFVLVPGIAFVVIFLEWFTLPYFYDFITFEFSLLFFLTMIGFFVYAILIRGLVRKSKYRIVGALRARRQSVSYEIAFSLYLLIYVIHINIFSFERYFSFRMLIIYLPFFLIIVAELNRAPFDFAEGERELVRGYNVEYSRVAFVLLFLREYGCLLFFRTLTSVLFFNFSFLVIYVMFSLLVFIRRSYPRYRYDFIINLFWFKLLPISLFWLLFYVMILIC